MPPAIPAALSVCRAAAIFRRNTVHSGRARQGGGRPPIHRHGGTVHGPTPHSYDLKVNTKAKKAALKCVLSEKIREKSPATPVIIVTGYGPIDGNKDVTVLQKDNLFPELLDKIKLYLGENEKAPAAQAS